MKLFKHCLPLIFAWLINLPSTGLGQDLEKQLLREPVEKLAADAKREGDAKRGALVFFQPHMACSKCHSVSANQGILLPGPNLAVARPQQSKLTDAQTVEAILEPSKTISPDFQSVTVLTDDGTLITGLPISRTEGQLTLREPQDFEKRHVIELDKIEKETKATQSLMPAGQVNQLNNRQQFLDLIKYLIEIRDGGPDRAAELQPPPSMLTLKVPEYEKSLDHAGLIKAWNNDSLERGKAIYTRVCANCHGTHEQPGSLPTSLRFAEGKFKNGSDPLSIYRTITYGYSQMTPQSWMVPSQKYDVIHYIREAYLKTNNPGQYTAVDAAYLSALPKGDTFGPEPSNIELWAAMDYGPTLTHTYEIPNPERRNLAYKGIAVRIDAGPGGVSRGRQWLLYDTDTMRVAGGWSGSGEAKNNFIDWQGIQFNGAHGVHPRTVGQTAFVNSIGPGWASPNDESFVDSVRVLGRDGKRYGPLPKSWTKFNGLYHFENRAILDYSVGATKVLESPTLLQTDGKVLLGRSFSIGPRSKDLILQVAEHSNNEAKLTPIAPGVVMLAPEPQASDLAEKQLTFDGSSYVQADAAKFNMYSRDFTIAARIRTSTDGSVWSLCSDSDRWMRNGQAFFVRGGKLGFDVGWVGAVSGKSKVDDGKWHEVVVSWQHDSQQLRLFVDGRLDGQGKLAAKAAIENGVVRIGFTCVDFPKPKTFFQGQIGAVKFWQRAIDSADQLRTTLAESKDLIAHWQFEATSGDRVEDSQSQIVAMLQRGSQPVAINRSPIVSGFSPNHLPMNWLSESGALRLRIPAGSDPLNFTLWIPSDGESSRTSEPQSLIERYRDIQLDQAELDLSKFTRGGPARWPQKLTTPIETTFDQGPFATDNIVTPDNNPWLAQLRLTGLDFYPDGRMAVCTWDGDVWLVQLDSVAADTNSVSTESKKAKVAQQATWQRIASGMFQPLGLKIVDGKIFVICRDQLTKLHDLNGDGEVDYYECYNNDHQVTEHFHEFAMGLQTDDQGNFYYAKSGQHGLAAVVPHHGTLLKVSRDGEKTEILANGFRAANGVCLNPDGSFVVTDQEGFWNPKNRINWVTLDPSGKPKFYGNMLGYHDVTDSSDTAMEPPLCWITNAFDRSPGELLWVDSPKWNKLSGSLLNLSYGYGKVFLVPHEKVAGQMQGGMIELPIPNFPTGVMRGRFHPQDQHLYMCGMFAWAGNATQPGGLYRLRTTGLPMNLPLQLHAKTNSIQLTFTDPLDPDSVKLKNIQIKTWSLKRTANYGSKHFNESGMELTDCNLSVDGLTLTIRSPQLKATWCMEIKYSLRSKSGQIVEGVIHNTIHQLAE